MFRYGCEILSFRLLSWIFRPLFKKSKQNQSHARLGVPFVWGFFKCELVIQHLLNSAVVVTAGEMWHLKQEVLKRSSEAGMASDIHEPLLRRKVFVGRLIKRVNLTFYWISPLCSFSGSAWINPSLWSRRLQFAGRAQLLTCWIANETLRRCCLNHPDSDWAPSMNVVLFFSESMPARVPCTSLQLLSLWLCSLIW